jgi:hypothetical protein
MLLPMAAACGHAQAIPTAIQQASLWGGVEASYSNPSFAPNKMMGIGGWVDADWRRGVGAEAEIRFLAFNGFYGEKESTYLFGPRAFLFPSTHWRPYGKLLVGDGRITYPFTIGSGGYFAIVAGGGLDYLPNRKWRFRVDYEYQRWLNSPGIKGEPDPDSIAPMGISLGIGYRIR